ncbi:hypothetical protein VIBRN418_17193, partial [Vibrio sp. N418]
MVSSVKHFEPWYNKAFKTDSQRFAFSAYFGLS